ncbi:Outer envelope pore protein 16-1 [Forsythia ovata]|uniref:Outer envelope pore protein 16-1 n=1 Tax=Forsythia ovata TaxID=205694 RepID=A0ABD1T722_9LAMI
MSRSILSGSYTSPKVDLIVDMGNPFLNLTVDGFLKIGTVAAARVAAEEAYYVVKRGAVAAVYVGMEYGAERVRGTRDWKNAMLGGALTGAIMSVASNNKGDKIVTDAIAGGAVATAAEFLNYLT